MKEQKRTEDLLKILRDVPPPDPQRQAMARAAFLQEAARRRAEGLAPRRPLGFPRLVSLRPLAVALLLVGLVLASLSGTAYAADRARPGDPLYPLDRSLETLQLRLTRDPQRAAALRLAQAEERLLEAESLALDGDETHLDLALAAYLETLQTLPPSPTLDQMVSRHELRLRQLREKAPQHARRGLERVLEVVEKHHPPSSPTDHPPSAEPNSHPTTSTPSKDHRGPAEEPRGKTKDQGGPAEEPRGKTKDQGGPAEEPPGKTATKTPHRPLDTEAPKENDQERTKGKD